MLVAAESHAVGLEFEEVAILVPASIGGVWKQSPTPDLARALAELRFWLSLGLAQVAAPFLFPAGRAVQRVGGDSACVGTSAP